MKLLAGLLTCLGCCGLLSAAEIPLDVAQSQLKFTGHAFLHDFQGEAKTFSGSAEVNTHQPEVVTSAHLEIQAARLTTHETTRDRYMDAWLKADANPKIVFALRKVRLVAGDAASATREHPAKFAVDGEFILNRQRRPISAFAMGWREGKLLVVEGATKVTTTDYGLPLVKQFFMTVDAGVEINFHLAFDLPPELRLTSPK